MSIRARIYLAPMEGVTTFVYRNAHAAVYGPMDKYFTPFLEPREKRSMKTGERREVLPEHNRGLFVVPQILTNKAEGFVELAETLQNMGYGEINLNLGCPSKTVVTRGKGSGFLASPEELDRFFDAVFRKLSSGMKVSVKTRIGMEAEGEWEGLLEIYNRYPLKELIIHPRLQQDYYKNQPRRETFRYALKESKAPLCYNGDLFTEKQIAVFETEFSQERCLMLGRGIILNPGLPVVLREEPDCRNENVQLEKFQEFHQRLVEGYQALDIGDRNVLFKMKELWFYQIHLFEHAEKYGKKIKKAQNLETYREAVRELLGNCRIAPPGSTGAGKAICTNGMLLMN